MCALLGAQGLDEMIFQRCQNIRSCQYVVRLTDVKRHTMGRHNKIAVKYVSLFV